MIKNYSNCSLEIQPLNGKLAWFAAVEKVVEIIAVNGNIVTFAVIHNGKLRVNSVGCEHLQLMDGK